MSVSTNQAVEMLVNYKIKPSYQRVKVLEYLLNDYSHPTAEEIFEGLSTCMPPISKATVYNTLNLFNEKNLVSTMSANRAETRYDLVVDAHGHFVCSQCKKIFNFPYKYEFSYEGLEGFKIVEEEIVLKGLCNKCRGEFNENDKKEKNKCQKKKKL